MPTLSLPDLDLHSEQHGSGRRLLVCNGSRASIATTALLCTSPGGEGGSSYPLHTLAELPDEERSRVSRQNLDTRFDHAWLREHPADRALAEFMAERAMTPRTDEQRTGEAAQLEARRQHDVWDRLPAIGCPTFVACGRFDGLAPPANSEAIRSRVPDSELHVYEGGHLFIYQDPRALTDITTFLTTHPPE